MRVSTRYIVSTLLLLHSTLLVAEDWSMCAVPALTRSTPVDPDSFATEITADLLQRRQEDTLEFHGDVVVQRDQQRVTADQVTLFQNPQRISASGNVRLSDDLLSLNADSMESDSERDYSLFDNTHFTLYDVHLRGTASSVEQKNADLREFRDVRYTTCDPGSNTWSLSADRLQLDESIGMGTAHHSILRVGPVPIFYFPWFRFPITDERLSGFLPPLLSSSDNDGVMLSTPFYWNLADHYDMTITPNLYTKRGLQLNTENRYLFDASSGELLLSWLDDDVAGEDRWFRYWSHRAELGAGIRASLLTQRVSDDDFVEDFDNLRGVSNVDYLQNALQFDANPGGWNSTLLFDEYQTVNSGIPQASRPYKRLPRLTMNQQFELDNSPAQLYWPNEWVVMERGNSVTGQRLRAAPLFSYPVEGDYFFVTPALQLDLTHYALDNTTTGEKHIDRSVPLLSLDSGLFFERVADSSGNWLQTLEPRLYMLYAPYRNQSGIPLFDTSILTESYHTLFINNRFSGADRIGDGQQITLAITTRFLDLRSGREVFSASIGQAAYFKDRRVSIGTSVDARNESGLMSLLSYQPDEYWRIDLSNNYDQGLHESERTGVSIRRHQGDMVFNLEYHYLRNSLEQSTISVVYPLTNTWTGFFKQQHSILHDKPVQNLSGFSYESCCWRFDVLYEKSTEDDFLETDRSVYFQFTFKGLGGAGNDIEAQLEQDISGYRPSR